MQKKIYNYALHPDKSTLSQFEHCFSQPFVVSAALMPDAHSGYVAPIGSVLITKDYIVPSWVGFDIGCGMIALQIKNTSFEKIKEKSSEIYKEVIKEIPMGVGNKNRKEKITQKTKDKFKELLEKFLSETHDKKILNFIKNSAENFLGTLGGGNHFIEICSDKKGKGLWLVIHSGSRGLGHDIAKHYMVKSSGSEKNFELTFPLKDTSQLGKEYLSVLNFLLEFALLNRLEMAEKVEIALKKIISKRISLKLWVNKNHNHAIFESGFYIHRKGATPAKKNERGVIPANMRDGSFLVSGLGNKKFLNSSSHGAGRALSRNEARKKISMSDFRQSMNGITGTVSEKTLDEAPQAYKPISDVMDAQKSSVKIIKHLVPIINWKG